MVDKLVAAGVNMSEDAITLSGPLAGLTIVVTGRLVNYERDAPLHTIRGVHGADALTVERHLARLRLHQPGDGLEQRGLACPVGADECHDFPGLHAQRYAP